MAINEQHREDLLKEATAYRRRLLFQCLFPHSSLPGCVGDSRDESICQEVFWGLRDTGAWSIYVGQDPVLQFTPKASLRRLFWNGQRYAARNGGLLRLARETVGGKVQFQEQPLVADDQPRMIAACLRILQVIVEQWQSGCCRVLGQVPTDNSQLSEEMLRLLRQVEHGFCVADSRRL